MARRVALCSSRCEAWLGSAAWADFSSACRRSISFSIYLYVHLAYLHLYLYVSIYQARLVHVIGIIWVQLIMYDSIKQGLGLPATGH